MGTKQEQEGEDHEPQTYILASWKRCMAVIMQILAILFNGSAMASSHWIKVGHFRTGIFEKCTYRNLTEEQVILTLPDAPFPGECGYSLDTKDYIKAVAALQVLGCVCSLIGAIANIFGLKSDSGSRKHIYYKMAMYLALLGVLLQFTGLVVFPIYFDKEVAGLDQDFYSWATEWGFGWAYFLAWGAAICTLGAALLIFWDRNHEEIQYKEMKPTLNEVE